MTSEGANSDREAAEAEVVEALAGGDRRHAVTLVLRAYGPEILRFLIALHGDRDEASEVFSLFAEAIWSAVARFEQRSSVRTWAYAIARRTSLRHRRDRKRRAARYQPFPEDSALSALEARVRTETLSFLRTERKSKLRALRDALPREDQVLLMLRVDRAMSWEDLARVLREGAGAALSDDDLKRESARLRKRFQLLKDRLRKEGERQGLLGSTRT